MSDTTSPQKKATYRNNLITPTGRVVYPNLAAPDTQGKFAKGKYKLTLILDKSAIGPLVKACNECAAEAFPGVDQKLVMMPFRDGSQKSGSKHPERFAGKVYITPTTRKQPITIDLAKQALPPLEVYGGCHARCIVSAASYESTEKIRDSATGQLKMETSYGVTFYLEKVQKVKDDERWGGQQADFPEGEDDAAQTDAYNQAAKNVTELDADV